MKQLVCKVCGNHVGLWGGFGRGAYWKHQVSRKLIAPHKPEPVTQAEYDRDYKGGQTSRKKRMAAHGN